MNAAGRGQTTGGRPNPRQLYTSLMTALPILLMALAAHPGPCHQGDQTAALYQKVLPSVVTLYAENKDGSSSLGSGFLGVRKGVVVTSWHVVDDAKQVTVRFADGTQTQARGIIDFNAESDIALLEIASLDRPRLQLKAGLLPVGSRVFTIGAPEGLEFSITEGLISQHRSLGQVPAYQISCAVSHGNSGGPVLTAEGEVCGIVRSRVGNESSLGFAVDAGEIKSLDPSKALQSFAAPRSSPASPAKGDEKAKANSALIRLAAQAHGALLDSAYRWVFEWEKAFRNMNAREEPLTTRLAKLSSVPSRNLPAFDSAVKRVQALLARLAEDERCSTSAVRDFVKAISGLEHTSNELSDRQREVIQLFQAAAISPKDASQAQFEKSYEDLNYSQKKLSSAYSELELVFSRETWFDSDLYFEALPSGAWFNFMSTTIPGLRPDPDLQLGCYVGLTLQGSPFARGDRVSGLKAEGEDSFASVRDWGELARYIRKHISAVAYVLQVERGETKLDLPIKIKGFSP